MRSISRFFETYHRISRTDNNNSVDNNDFSVIRNIMFSAMYTYFDNSNNNINNNNSSFNYSYNYEYKEEEEEEKEEKDPFISVSKISSTEKDCTICFDSYTEESVKKGEVVITECGHVFHKGCIADWVKISRNCPICRTTF